MKKAFDLFGKYFDNMDEFLVFLTERENSETTRLSVASSSVSFVTIERALMTYGTIENLAKRLNVDEDLIKDTQDHSKIIVSINKTPYLLGDSSWISIKNRIGIYGYGFDLLDTKIMTTVLNDRFQEIGNKEVQIIIVNEKIRAIMSDEYSVVPIGDLFTEVMKEVNTRYDDNFELRDCYVDHNIARCKLLFPELGDEINRLYNLPDEYIPGVIIQSSDTGFSANRVGTFWKTKRGTFINSNEYIELIHKGNNSMDKVLDELPNLFLKYQNTVKKFAKLMMIELKNPVKVIKLAGKHIGLPKRITKQIVEQFDIDFASTSIVTAYDICSLLFMAPTLVDNGTVQLLEEKVGKAINLNYTKLDEADED